MLWRIVTSKDGCANTQSTPRAFVITGHGHSSLLAEVELMFPTWHVARPMPMEEATVSHF